MAGQLIQISFDQWDTRYRTLRDAGMKEPSYGGPLSRHLSDGDVRLPKLKYDRSAEALRLWNFLLSEEERLHEARKKGFTIVGAMKDLGTVPVMAYSLPETIAFYPDGAWWIPCVMELSQNCLQAADALGIDESFCPVRAMLGAFVTGEHFPVPDLLTCSTGAVCDDFSAIAQRLNSLGYPVLWWEIPYRRPPERGEQVVKLPGGYIAPDTLVRHVTSELERIRRELESVTGSNLDDDRLAEGIARANHVRSLLDRLRTNVFTAECCPLPSLELLIAEMLAIHFCSNLDETIQVLEELNTCVRNRIDKQEGYFSCNAVRMFWINPVADLRMMNIMEECGGRICGTDNLFYHALDLIPEDIPPIEALARMALADQMVGSSADRADRICRDIEKYGSEAVVISRIPGASHCAIEGKIITEIIQQTYDIPVIEIEVPPVSDALQPSITTRLQALCETVRSSRK
jgi:benzoyl-CoA reductase/2-hydroxyglutaryl-CoA dehydratase subunit BcrC/BadD/HgdB